MGNLKFQLPFGVGPEYIREMELICVAGGPDNMPYPSRCKVENALFHVLRESDESGYLVAPWTLDHFGTLMGSSATLMEREAPYRFLVELARGKINQVRNQLADWRAGGLVVSSSLSDIIRDMTHQFGRQVCSDHTPEDNKLLPGILHQGYQAASHLVQTYIEQVFHIRHQRHPRLETALMCPLSPAIEQEKVSTVFRNTFTRCSLPFPWHRIESDQGRCRWKDIDRLLDWAEANNMSVQGGPLIDFSASMLPPWLWEEEYNQPTLTTFMCRFAETVLRRYRSRIRRWQLTTGSNRASLLGLDDHDLMDMTFRLGETARQLDSSLELVLGISQPWGEFMISSERISPFIFADNLIRSGLNLAAINLELVMGVKGRGSFCRDLLDLSRLLDMYGLLGVPLQVTLGYPSSSEFDPDADPELIVGAGTWKDGFSPQMQEDWASQFTSLCLCKPYIHAVQWVHLADSDPHQFPSCGLISRQGEMQPAFQVLQRFREVHLEQR